MTTLLYVLCGFFLFFSVILFSISLAKFFGENSNSRQGAVSTFVMTLFIGLAILCCYIAEKISTEDKEPPQTEEITIFDEKKPVQKQEPQNTVTIIQYDTVYNDHIDTCNEFGILQGGFSPFFL